MTTMLLCAECNTPTEFLLVDIPDEKPLQFCSWECLAIYAVKVISREREEP